VKELVAIGVPNVVYQNMKESKDRTEQFMYSAASAANQAPSSPLTDYNYDRSFLSASSSFQIQYFIAPNEAIRWVMAAPIIWTLKGKVEPSKMVTFWLWTSAQQRRVWDPREHLCRCRWLNNRFVSVAVLVYPVIQKKIQDSYIRSRSTAIESIEATIAELGQIFTQLANMVAEQRETVQRIDADTVDIASNVSGAQRELLKYYASISSNRWLMLKVFGVLIVFVSFNHLSSHNLHLILYSS